MHDEPLWLEPDYFESFRCKCGACRNCCCNGWDVAVSQEEYFRLIGMDCSDELHHKLECAFRVPEEPSPQRFRLISPNWLGECPLRDTDGLCALQKECGEAVLPEICRIYPRSLKREGEMLQACCSNSCEAVVESLMEKDKLRFTFARLDSRPELTDSADVQSLMLGRICMEILQDRAFSLRDRLGKICRMVDERNSKAGSAAHALAALLGIQHNLQSNSLECFIQGVFDRYNDAEIYLQDARKFEARFPEWECWLENILINHMVYMAFPRVDGRISIPEALKGLCVLWGMLRMLCAFYTQDHPHPEDFVDVTAAIFRLVEHSAFYYNCHVLVEDYWQFLAL